MKKKVFLISLAVVLALSVGLVGCDIDEPQDGEEEEEEWELDHFKCYIVNEEERPSPGEDVSLKDQFVAINATVGDAWWFCNPVEKGYEGGETSEIWNDDYHLVIYSLDHKRVPPPEAWQVEVSNQFGTEQQLVLTGPAALAVPTRKLLPEDRGPLSCLEHFLIYWVHDPSSYTVSKNVTLNDQFGSEENVLVSNPWIFAIPVRKTHKGFVTEIENQEDHLVFYVIESSKDFKTEVQVDNQFGGQTLKLLYAELLAVPSVKVSATPLDSLP